MGSTKELLNELIKTKDIKKTVQEFEKEFITGTLSDFFNDMLKKYRAKRLDVINRANISVSYGYQMMDGAKKPKREKIIQLCFGFPLTLDEIQTALRLGGVSSLYARNKRDAYIMYAASQGQNLETLNKFLYEVGEPEIGAEE